MGSKRITVRRRWRGGKIDSWEDAVLFTRIRIYELLWLGSVDIVVARAVGWSAAILLAIATPELRRF